MSGLRGIVGIEAAIVLIAFVLVASALAFVAINMGMLSAQKSKEVMAKAYDSATKALDVAGDAIAKVNTAKEQVTAVFIPVKLTAGTTPIDLSKTVVSLLIQLPNGTAVAYANTVSNVTSLTPVTSLSSITGLQSYTAKWYIAQGNNNTLLEPGEVAILAINVTDNTGNGLGAYGAVQVEIKPPTGAPLVARYTIPPTLTSEWIDLVLGQ